MATIEQQLQSLVLSAGEVSKLTGWPESMVEEWLNLLINTTLLATSTDTNIDGISTNKANISTNTANISTNTTNISTNATTISDHISATSAHGATGNVIGTGNTTSTGTRGPVFLAAAVANATASSVSVTSPDASAAPVAYDQAQNQELVDLSNELKADVNTLVSNLNSAITQVNALLATLRTSGVLNT